MFDPYIDYTSYWTEITSVQWVKDGDFYDLTVPSLDHYSAQGLWHHNCGKTQVGAVEIFLQALEYQGRRGEGLVARHAYKGLMATTWQILLDTIPQECIRDVIEAPPKGPRIILKNNFHLIGWNLKSGQGMSSLNLAVAWIDEVNEEGINERHYKAIRGRLRDPRGSRQTLLTGNCEGKNWVYEKFFAAQYEPGKKQYKDHEGFIPKVGENTFLPADYLDNLRDIYDDVWIGKYLEGSFEIFEGQVFDNFSREFHLTAPFAIPDTWPRFRGVDHGLTHPTVCLWLASDFEGNYIIYRCYYQRNSVPAENAANILRLSEGEETDWTVIDPSTHQTQTAGGTAERIIDQYRMAGLVCEPGNNAVRDSIVRIRHLLQPDPGHPFPKWHPRGGELGAPHLFITADCTELIWELGQYAWKQVKPDGIDREAPLAKHDDCIACLRYLVMRSPRPPAETVQPSLYDRFLAIANELKGESPLGLDRESLADITGNQLAYARR